MRTFQLLILVFWTACNNSDSIRESTVSRSYDTLSNGLRIINRTIDSPYYYKDQVATDSLKGDYQVYYAQDDSSYFLYLKHRDSLSLLNKTTKYTSLYHLGKVMDDEQKYFILGHDNGNGSPYSHEYIDKQTGKNPLGFGKKILDYKQLNGTAYLLYWDTNINGKTQLTLFNTDNKKKEYYEWQIEYDELYIDTLTTKNLVLQYTLNGKEASVRTRMYRR